MASLINNQEIETCLRGILLERGYSLSPIRAQGENGADIIAIKEGEELFIEVIGFKEKGSSRAKDFFEVFFRAVSRLDIDAKKCVIALPDRAKNGLPQRVKRYKIAWERIGNAFPELEIWLVDTIENRCICTSWNHWLFYAYFDLAYQNYWEL